MNKPWARGGQTFCLEGHMRWDERLRGPGVPKKMNSLYMITPKFSATAFDQPAPYIVYSPDQFYTFYWSIEWFGILLL